MTTKRIPQPLSLRERIDATLATLNEQLAEAHKLNRKSVVTVVHATRASPSILYIELREHASARGSRTVEKWCGECNSQQRVWSQQDMCLTCGSELYES